MSDTTATTTEPHEKPHYDGINTPVLLVTSIVSAAVTFALIAGAQAYFYHVDSAELYRKDLSISYRPAVEHIEAQKHKLETFQLDADKTVIIPLEQAKAKVMQKYAKPAETDAH